MKRLVAVAVAMLSLSAPVEARGRGGGGCCSFVSGYVRSNSTYVHSYFRSSPGLGRYRTDDASRRSFGPYRPETQISGSVTPASMSTGDALGASMQETREAVAGPHPDCAGHKMYGTGYGVCVEGGQAE